MKILYFHQHFSTPQGSSGIRSYAMSQILINEGHEVTIVCGRYSGSGLELQSPIKKGERRGRVEGINIIELDIEYSNSQSFLRRTLQFLRYAYRSIKIALIEDYDLALATSTPLTAALPGLFAKWIRRKNFIFEVRDLWPELPRAMGVIKNPIVLGLMSVLERLAYYSADKCIGLSPGIVNGILDKSPSKKVAMIPNGCDLEIFDTARVTKWRPAEIDIAQFLVVFTGTHGFANGLSGVIEAATELQNRGRTDISILLVGDGKLKPSLQRSAQRKGLQNLYFHKPLQKSELVKLMSSADAGLQILANVPAFYYGTSPNKFFDYLAAGLPIICNYPGWVADLITEHNCGRTALPDDPQSLAEQIIYLADNRSELTYMGANARKLAEEQFSRQILGERFKEWVTP